MSKINKMANKFILKYGQELSVAQAGTSELFFGTEEKQRAFGQAIMDPNGEIGKFLMAYATKSQKTASFDLKATAEPGSHAGWLLQTVPHSLMGQIDHLLNIEFDKIVGGTLSAKAAEANDKAKSGGGSGTLNIGSLIIDF